MIAVTDTVYIKESANTLITIVLPVAMTLFVGVVSIVAVFISARLAGRKYAEDYKLATVKEISTLEGQKVGWSDFEQHRRDNNEATVRIYEKMEASVNQITNCLSAIKRDLGDVKGAVMGLKGAFEQHTRQEQ